VKFTIILKQQDADGLGGDLLEAMGMVRSEHAPTVFTRQLPMHNVEKLGTGDNSWSQPEQHTQMYVEALADYGIRPMRVFQKHDSAAGLTPLHASAWADAKPASVQSSAIEQALSQVESAVEALSGGKVEAANPKMYAQSALKSLARLEGHIKKILQETDGNEYDSSHLAGLDEALDELISRFIGY